MDVQRHKLPFTVRMKTIPVSTIPRASSSAQADVHNLQLQLEKNTPSNTFPDILLQSKAICEAEKVTDEIIMQYSGQGKKKVHDWLQEGNKNSKNDENFSVSH